MLSTSHLFEVDSGFAKWKKAKDESRREHNTSSIDPGRLAKVNKISKATIKFRMKVGK